MHDCVDTQSTVDGDTDKSKVMETARVMKGALSVSKSKTGEVIYRTNKNEVKYLDRRLLKFDKDITRAKTNIECQKRDILRKWSMVFGQQKTLCESIKSFDEMINSALEKQLMETNERSYQLENCLNSHREDEPVAASNSWSKLKGADERRQSKQVSGFGNSLSMPVLVNPKRSRTNPAVPRLKESGVPASLPKINNFRGGNFFSGVVDEKSKAHRQEKERENAKKEFPDFSKSTMESYFNEQKQLQEDLMTRNSLSKLKNSVNEGHNFYKLRIRTKLPEDADLLIESIETDRSKTKSVKRNRKPVPNSTSMFDSKKVTDILDEDFEKEILAKFEKEIMNNFDIERPSSFS
ncbi:hypothetical protein SNE40_006741 [Patella caerulea]|uniref:Uncharacterized protein n=1 Tax=Patella caerulea TaxID=87958 RepID=A0AAN8JUQ7_PATCE